MWPTFGMPPQIEQHVAETNTNITTKIANRGNMPLNTGTSAKGCATARTMGLVIEAA